MREQISERLVPLLLARGFDGPSKVSGNALSHTYTRILGHEKHQLDIRLEKHGLARFKLAMYAFPHPIPDIMRGKVVDVPTGTLTPRRGVFSFRWFRADPTIVEKLLRRDVSTKAQQAVAMCIGMLSEVDEWFERKTESANVQSLLLPGPLQD